MAIAYSVLAQANPAATTETDIYTVPSATETIVSTITVCNFDSTVATIRLYIAVAGAVTANKQYIYYDLTIPGNDTFAATFGLTLGATDVIRAYCSTNTLAINIFGQENS